jgi:hypothetical protein
MDCGEAIEKSANEILGEPTRVTRPPESFAWIGIETSLVIPWVRGGTDEELALIGASVTR